MLVFWRIKGAAVQVNDKSVSSLEYDVLTGTYKKVDKEDNSDGFIDNAFFELLMASTETDRQNAYSSDDMSQTLQEASSIELSSDKLSANLYSLRFKQDEDLRLIEGQKSAQQIKNSLMSDLLSAL